MMLCPCCVVSVQAEQFFRLKDVRQRFVSILNQPRAKQRFHGQRAGPAGQFRVHGQGFDTLMQLASAVLNACLSEKDHVTAHTLLQVMGRYYQVPPPPTTRTRRTGRRDRRSQPTSSVTG